MKYLCVCAYFVEAVHCRPPFAVRVQYFPAAVRKAHFLFSRQISTWNTSWSLSSSWLAERSIPEGRGAKIGKISGLKKKRETSGSNLSVQHTCTCTCAHILEKKKKDNHKWPTFMHTCMCTHNLFWSGSDKKKKKEQYQTVWISKGLHTVACTQMHTPTHTHICHGPVIWLQRIYPSGRLLTNHSLYFTVIHQWHTAAFSFFFPPSFQPHHYVTGQAGTKC